MSTIHHFADIRWPLDLTVVEADEPYACIAGDDGVQFLVVRGDKATFIAK